jgi:spore germination protein YaaH
MVAPIAALNLAACVSSGSGSQPGSDRLSIVAGYLVPWDARSMAAIEQDTIPREALTELSPAWYQPDETGQIAFVSSQARQSAAGIETLAIAKGLALMPSIANYRDGRWDGALVHHLLNDPQARITHIAAISALAESHLWAGIDLDYESLSGVDRDVYSRFIRDLGEVLHQAHKRLSVTVHAKTAEPGDWSGAKSEDWRALGAAADEMRIMAYDHANDETPPGAIAPIGWVERTLQLAVTEIPRDKIILGVGAYGYDWNGEGRGKTAQWADAETIAKEHAAVIHWDTRSQAPWFSYTDAQGQRHTLWYENARSMKTKLDLARRYTIAGVIMWRLGGEDPAIWKEILQPV